MSTQVILSAMASPTRRALFGRLLEGAASVAELTRSADVTQPAVSQHLQVLREAGLVEMTREGRRHIYRPRLAALEELRAWVDGMWDDALGAFERYATDERPERGGSS